MLRPQHAAFAAVLVAIAAPAFAEPLTLETAIARTLAAAPEAAANTARVEALTAARRQAGVKPNPAVELVADNFAGTGNYRLLDATELSATYAQTIERGGKRAARVALAEREIGVAEAESLAQRLDIVARVQRAHVETLAAEAAIETAAERLRLARALASEVDRRVKAARDPIFAGSRAATRVAEARVDLELAEHVRDAALVRLTALWGGTPAQYTLSTADFFRFDRGRGVAGDPAMADLGVYEARAARAEAAVAIERARRVQDPVVRGGFRFLRPADDLAVVAGISIPLTRNDTNRANVDRALAESRRAAADIEVARVARVRELRLAEEKVEEARHEAEAVRDRVVPVAERTLAEVRAGYARGGFAYLDVAEAANALAAARARLVAATTQYQSAGVDLDRLTGRFIALVQEEAR